MTSFVDIVILPDQLRLRVECGSLLHTVLAEAGYSLRTPCGGNGTCGKCLVWCSTGASSFSLVEQWQKDNFTQPLLLCDWNSRLSLVEQRACQVVIRESMIVWLPENSLHQKSHQIVTSHVVSGDASPENADWKMACDSVLQTLPLQISPPVRDDAVSDIERFQNAVMLSNQGKSFELSLTQLRGLPGQLRRANWQGNAVSAFDRLVAFQSNDHAREKPVKYAVAVDIGTTTLAAELLDLNVKKSCGVVARHNPQAALGDDIISRIQNASQSPEQLDRLHKLVINAVNGMIYELTQKGAIEREQIAVISIAGNTVMQQLFCKIDPQYLGQAPFAPAITKHQIFRASELGIAICPHGLVLIFPVIGGFVGGDLVAGLVATDMCLTTGASLLIDIGTNGEMILWCNKTFDSALNDSNNDSDNDAGRTFDDKNGSDKNSNNKNSNDSISDSDNKNSDNNDMNSSCCGDQCNCGTGKVVDQNQNVPRNGCCYAAATAAGPAFEGARIQHGMIAAPGAIERVEIGATFVIRTIGNRPPIGICGSGLIDLVAELIRIGAITPTGQLLSADKLPETVPASLRSRFVAEGRQCSFVIAAAEESGNDHAIVLTQRDIRQVQLAAGAVRTGITLLLRKAGLTQAELKTVYLAGGFGNYIRPKNAQQIGLLPPEIPTERIQFCGNTSLAGAKDVLLDQNCYREMCEWHEVSEHVDLSRFPEFQTVFTESMCFPVRS